MSPDDRLRRDQLFFLAHIVDEAIDRLEPVRLRAEALFEFFALAIPERPSIPCARSTGSYARVLAGSRTLLLSCSP